MSYWLVIVTHAWPVLGANRAGPGVFDPPSPNSAHGPRRDTQWVSGIQKSVKNHDKTIVQLFFRSVQKSGNQRPSKAKFFPLATFFDKLVYCSGTRSSIAPRRKNAFDSSFNAISVICSHIWHKFNDLASTKQKLKKPFLRKVFSAVTFEEEKTRHSFSQHRFPLVKLRRMNYSFT